MKLINTIKCFFGWHNWKLMYPDDTKKYLPKTGKVAYKELHYCNHCLKTKHLTTCWI